MQVLLRTNAEDALVWVGGLPLQVVHGAHVGDGRREALLEEAARQLQRQGQQPQHPAFKHV